MGAYTFTLVLESARELTTELEDAVFEAYDGDAGLGVVDGVAVLDFLEREATSAQEAILAAMYARGWHLVDDAPGVVLATVSSMGHRATVRIGYQAGSYSILYEDSSHGLKYRAHSQLIHRRYNHWVRRLDDAIRLELGRR